MRDILLRIFLDNDIQHRLDLSGEFFAQFNKRNEALCKNHLHHLRQPQQFVIFKWLSYFFEETIGFDIKALFLSCPVLCLIR